MYLYNPETFDPLAVLPPSLSKFSDDARYFVHKLYTGRVFNRRNKKKFQQLKAAYLRKVISERKYTAIRQALIDSQTILTDHHWIRGKKAIGYMLGPQFNENKHHRVEIINKRLIRKIKIHSGRFIKNIELDVHKHLFNYLKQIKIDYENAFLKIEEDFHIHELAIAMIRDKAWFFHVDKYGRVHTNITSLKTELRSFLMLNNKKLINIDIQNSQPFFLGVLLLDFYVNKRSISPSYNNISILSLIRCDILPKDVSFFVNLVKTGNLYEFIAENAGMKIEDRKEFKQKLFRDIFFCKNKPWETEYSSLFGRLFPNVYGVIKELKRKDYTSLAKLLQKMESSLIINTIIRQCMEQFPEMPVFTIHDSIMTTDLWVEKLHDIMLHEFGKIGIVPNLRVEQY